MRNIFLIIVITLILFSKLVISQDIQFTYKQNNHINANKVAFLDLNNDALLDVVCVNNDGIISINNSNGDGTFSTQQSSFTVASDGTILDIAVANMDEQCKKEIIVSDYANSKVHIIKGTTVDELEIIQTLDVAESSYYIKIADLNNDGFNDIIVFSYADTNFLTVFLNQPNNLGNFTELTPQEINNGFITDVNLDGNLDLLQNEGCWALGNGDGTFSTTYYNAGYYDSSAGALTDVGDLNGDGYPDLLKHRDSGDAVLIFRNNNGTSFTNVLDSWIGENINQTGGAIGDFNLDGNNDFVTTSWYSKIMRFSKQNNNNFAFDYDNLELNHGDVAQWGIQWQVIDLDNNGALDIVYKGNNLNVYINSIDGVFVEDTCTDETTFINDEIIENIFNIYPNPASTYVIIESKKLKGESLQILDITGKVVKHFKIQNSEFRIQIEDLENGVYFIKIGTQVQKFIKK